MKILINISVVSLSHRGMGIFTKEILLRLLENKGLEFILVSCTNIDEELNEYIQENNIFFIQINSPLPIFEQFILPILIKKYKVNSCWFPSNTFPIIKVKNVQYIATIHDIIFMRDSFNPNNIYQKFGKYYRKYTLLYGIKNLDKITSVSKTALDEINNYFNINDKISENHVLYNSIDIKQEFDDKVLDLYKIKNKKYIYTISGIAPHKNLDFLLNSFKEFQIINKNYYLIVTGAKGYRKKKNVIFTEFITNEEKNSLIKNADLFVFTSKEEGFGIPLIEAMSLSNNILASNIRVFKEIGKNYINYFNLDDTYFLTNYYNNNTKINNLSLFKIREYIINTFNIKISVNKLINIFKKD
jgi:glycosyltransferase involved in cell wall biosynthesis